MLFFVVIDNITIEDNVFVGHNVTFINDKYPRAITSEGELQTEDNWKLMNTIVKKGVSIGSSTTILCNITIGENGIIGAGSVVTKDVPPNSIVAGNPARLILRKWLIDVADPVFYHSKEPEFRSQNSE